MTGSANVQNTKARLPEVSFVSSREQVVAACAPSKPGFPERPKA